MIKFVVLLEAKQKSRPKAATRDSIEEISDHFVREVGHITTNTYQVEILGGYR